MFDWRLKTYFHFFRIPTDLHDKSIKRILSHNKIKNGWVVVEKLLKISREHNCPKSLVALH